MTSAPSAMLVGSRATLNLRENIGCFARILYGTLSLLYLTESSVYFDNPSENSSTA